MLDHLKPVAAAAVLIAGLAVAPILYANDAKTPEHDQSTMGQAMKGHGGMMNMMGQKNQMMDHCAEMMQGAMGDSADRPNEQWRKQAPKAPEKNG